MKGEATPPFAYAGTTSLVTMQRLGAPADIAPVVAFLASPEGHWINGQTIRVNGGII
jgi:3-oxoacyl-[acyl-carrier protein] reductase